MAVQTAAGLHNLRGFVGGLREDVALGDLAWARLSPWRRLTTQFFDVPGTLPVLDLIDEVSVTYGNSAHQWSGFSGALLYAGWLGSRLGWRTEFAWERYTRWVAGHGNMRLIERRPMPPLGHFSLIRFGKVADEQAQRNGARAHN